MFSFANTPKTHKAYQIFNSASESFIDQGLAEPTKTIILFFISWIVFQVSIIISVQWVIIIISFSIVPNLSLTNFLSLSVISKLSFLKTSTTSIFTFISNLWIIYTWSSNFNIINSFSHSIIHQQVKNVIFFIFQIHYILNSSFQNFQFYFCFQII